MIMIKKLNKKGVFSILAIIIMLTGMIIINGFITILYKTMAINEIQGVMDNSGLIALRFGVDEVAWRAEVLTIDMDVAEAKYRDLIQENLNTGERAMLKSFTLENVTIYPPDHPNLASLGIPEGERSQYYIESRIVATFNNGVGGSTWGRSKIEFFDFFNANESDSQNVEYEGVGLGGGSTVIIRSVTRLVLR